MRLCRRCGETKPLSAFDKRSGPRSHQVKSWCHVCTRAYFNDYMRRSYHRDPATWIAKQKARHVANPARVMLTTAKARAKKAGKDFSITLDDVPVPEFCPVLGTKLAVGNGGSTRNSPTIDRIDNTKGYIQGNVWVISRRANDLKADATLLELEALVTAIKKMATR